MFPSHDLDAGASVYNSTAIQGVEFLWGLIENNEGTNYTSKVDGSTQRAKITGLDNTDTTTVKTLTQLGSKSYQYGDITIKGNGIGDGPSTVPVSQAFTLTHTVLIGPWFLADEINDIKNGVAPTLFRDSNSPKYVFQVTAGKDINNPNKRKVVVEDEVLGNVGYLDENFNANPTNYSVTSPDRDWETRILVSCYP